jgi:hypothetical protein
MIPPRFQRFDLAFMRGYQAVGTVRGHSPLEVNIPLDIEAGCQLGFSTAYAPNSWKLAGVPYGVSVSVDCRLRWGRI